MFDWHILFNTANSQQFRGGTKIQFNSSRLIALLPPFCREVVQLRVFERLSYREIADVVGYPENTAQSRMALAIKRLRASFCWKVEPTDNLVDESSPQP